MSRTERRLERIKEDIDIVDVLVDYGYAVVSGGGYREQQFSCDLHGDGFDGKPSARVYPESQSWYCFACDKTRDAVETVREKEGVGFMDALRYLEKRYNLPDMGWEEGDYKPSKPEVFNPIEQNLHTGLSFDKERTTVETFLTELTKDRDLPMETLLGFWEAFDMLKFRLQQGMAEEKLAPAMSKLRHKVLEQSIEYQKKSGF